MLLFSTGHTLFLAAVPPVFRWSAKEKMLGVDTWRGIASVADTHSFGDWPLKGLVGESMSSMMKLVDIYNPISTLGYSACPNPTGVGLLDVPPEIVVNGEMAHGVASTAMLAAKYRTTIFDTIRSCQEVLVAVFANPWHRVTMYRHGNPLSVSTPRSGDTLAGLIYPFILYAFGILGCNRKGAVLFC